MSSFFATCNTNEDNMSTKSLIDSSFSNRFATNFYMSKLWNTCHSSNAFFAQSLACLLALWPPWFTFYIFFLSISKKQDFSNGLLIGDSFSPFNNIGSKSSKFVAAIISKSKNSSSPMARIIFFKKCRRRNIGTKIFKIQRNIKVKRMHRHIRICFKIQIGRINRRLCKRFMHVMNTLHINLTSITNPQKIITKISGDYWCGQSNKRGSIKN